MAVLKLASCMAENTEMICRGITAYIAARLGIETEYVTDIPWQERERLFDAGEIQILWLCGLPYVHKADLRQAGMELLAVPVPCGERYGARPVYFSDVIVRRHSAYRNFADLRGAPWAYNETRSHSGFNVVRAHLAALGERARFFSNAVETGAHSESLAMVFNGDVAGAAIDSTVLQWFGMNRRNITAELRVIEVLGPSPMPPWVISTRIAAFLRRALRRLLLGMHHDEAGQRILQSGCVERFLEAGDCDYDPIREMAQRAEAVSLV
jgi:phosphonate transport system substrate-binding protein